MGKKKGEGRKRSDRDLVKVPRSDAEWLSRAAAGKTPDLGCGGSPTGERPANVPAWPMTTAGLPVDPSALPVTRATDGEIARPALLVWNGSRWLLADESLSYAADLGDGTVPLDTDRLEMSPAGGSRRQDG